MPSSTDNTTQGLNMKLSKNEIIALRNYLADQDIHELAAANVLGITDRLLRTNTAMQLFLVVAEGGWINFIKTIRLVKGLGLKEAMDWATQMNPNKGIGTFGPIMRIENTVTHQSWYDTLMEKMEQNGITNVTVVVK